MPFVEFKETGTSNYSRPVYFTFTPGQHVIRILDEEAFSCFCYWLGSGYVFSPDENDPIRENSKRIRLENPDTYKDIKGYRTSTQRAWVNVLDKTISKVCPNCEADVKSTNGNFPMLCPKCGTSVANVEPAPLNKVRLFSGGKTLFNQFLAFEKTILDKDGEPVGLTNFDIMLNVTGENRKREVFAIPTQNFEPVDTANLELFDTANAVIRLSTEEMEQIVRGVSLKDIFAARKAENDTDDGLSDDEEKEVADNVAKVFS